MTVTGPNDSASNSEASSVDRPQPERVRWGAVILFTALAFLLAWFVSLPMWIEGGLDSPLAGLLLVVMMWTPALATVVALLVMRVPHENRARWLGLWPLRPARRVVWFIVLATVAPMFVVALTVAVSALFGLVTLDLVNFSGYVEELQATTPPELVGLMPPVWVLVASQLALIPLGAVINSVLAFGEEIGWRGWLLSALRPLGTWPALILTGIIWGLWHSPIILLGYNFARPNLTGVLLIVGGCVAWGILLGWSRLRSGSVWPAVVGHGSLNAAGAMVLLLAASGQEIDLAIVGPLGFVAWVVIAAITVGLAVSGQFAKQPGLAPSRTT